MGSMQQTIDTLCKDIKGIETGNILKSCDGCILEAVKIIKEYIFKEQ